MDTQDTNNWQPRHRNRAFALLISSAVHISLVLLFLTAHGNMHASQRLAAITLAITASTPTTPEPVAPAPPKLADIAAPQLQTPPPLDIAEDVAAKPPAQPAQPPAAAAPSQANAGSYDDPYAGAALGVRGGQTLAIAPPPPALPPPTLDDKLWTSLTDQWKATHSTAHSLSMLARMDAHGIITDCHVMGGDASAELQHHACAMLIGKALFIPATPITVPQWRVLPDVVF